jgi:hypothetical protein
VTAYSGRPDAEAICHSSYHRYVFPFKSRDELRGLPEDQRLRYVARYMWISLALGIGFGLEVAFVEGFHNLGLLLSALGLLGIPFPIWLTLRARRLRRLSG